MTKPVEAKFPFALNGPPLRLSPFHAASSWMELRTHGRNRQQIIRNFSVSLTLTSFSEIEFFVPSKFSLEASIFTPSFSKAFAFVRFTEDEDEAEGNGKGEVREVGLVKEKGEGRGE